MDRTGLIAMVIAAVLAFSLAAQRSSTPQSKGFDDSLVSELKVPPGFRVTVFAKGLGQPRMMAVSHAGFVYVTRPEASDVVLLKSVGPSMPVSTMTALSGLDQVHGITIFENKVYLTSPTTIWSADIQPGGLLSSPRVIARNLPGGGQHTRHTIAVGPDRSLYVSIGSSCNDCAESDRERATIQRFNLEGGDPIPYARGLRNTIGFAWHPDTGELWGMDNGADGRGDNAPPEELNKITQGADFGWPICYGKRVVDRVTVAEPREIVGEEITRDEYCATTLGPVLEYAAHNAPIGMIFYTGKQFPVDFHSDALVAFHGSWNRLVPDGYKVARIRFRNGVPVGFENFLTGFLSNSGRAQFGRPAGIAVAADGAVLISDDSNGVIYRVSYEG